MLVLCFAFLLLAGGAFWLTGVHPARNVLRLRRTLVSFFLLLGVLSLALQIALQAPVEPRGFSSAQGMTAGAR
ncbi:MAG: hypothetical protein ACK5PG_07120 [Lysobacterales bacterium]|jgi:hypothetical protein